MITTWVLIGVGVGSLLGFTGAGGAIIAVPLFMQLTHASIREATVLSLIAVSLGALLNWLLQRRNTVYRAAIPIYAFSVAGSLVARPLKAITPEWGIALIFVAIGLLSLLSIWKDSTPGTLTKPTTRSGFGLSAIFGGFGFGAVVTLTGLGGGVLLVPLLKRLFRMPFAETTATSLLLIIFASISSLALQWKEISDLASPSVILALGVGSSISALLIRGLVKRVDPRRIDTARKLALTSVIVFSILSVSYATR